MTQENDVTSNCTVSPATDKIETAASEKLVSAVASGQISLGSTNKHSHHVNHGSQHQQKQKCTNPQNTFIYKIDTTMVPRIDKEISNSNEPSFWISKVLNVSNGQGDSLPQGLKLYSFDTTRDP